MNIPEDQIAAMSPAYWQRWNDDVQKKIDADIEANRKAEGCFIPGTIPAGADVQVEQFSHSYIFGAHIFNFDQLGTDERNRKYKALYGTLFNSATIAFYWRTLEPEQGKPRFAASECDTAAFWNQCGDPKHQPHWRRPAVDPVVDFCLGKGIRLHGHVLVWGSNRWQMPDWVYEHLPAELKDKVELTKDAAGVMASDAAAKVFEGMTAEEVADRYPEFVEFLNLAVAKRVYEIALRYGKKFDSWDIVNESATDFQKGNLIPGARFCKSWYGMMPGDYPYRGFKLAESVLPAQAKLNINDYSIGEHYVQQVGNLRARGCRIDIVGAQMHLFNPQQCLDIAAGTYGSLYPEQEWEKMTLLARTGLPVHMSEITITAPHNDARGQAIQAVIARNLYRLWFSSKCTMGITWWNVVDDCGAPGEPSVSGLFSRSMEPKPAYFALDDLINNQWKTRTCVKAGKDGSVSFRGFRGAYRLTWLDPAGNKQTANVILN